MPQIANIPTLYHEISRSGFEISGPVASEWGPSGQSGTEKLRKQQDQKLQKQTAEKNGEFETLIRIGLTKGEKFGINRIEIPELEKLAIAMMRGNKLAYTDYLNLIHKQILTNET